MSDKIHLKNTMLTLRAEQLRVNALPGNTTPERDQPLMPAAPTALPDEAQ